MADYGSIGLVLDTALMVELARSMASGKESKYLVGRNVAGGGKTELLLAGGRRKLVNKSN